MSALPRPDLPSGPHRDLVTALHELHHRAGWPSLRTLARETGVSHTTVSKAFSQPALPTWGTLELLVEAMDGSVEDFRTLWLAASAPTNGDRPPTPRIAGRRTELEVVRRHLETGTGLLLVTGEAGIGKTTLVDAAAAGMQMFVLSGRCLPLSSEVPLMPFADALRTLLRTDHARVRKALADCPRYVARELTRMLPELDDGHGVDASDDFSRQRLFSSISRLLDVLSTQDRLAVVVEDLHWADSSTLDLLEHLCAVRTGLGIVGTWREGDDSVSASNAAWRLRVRTTPGTTTVVMTPLTLDETAAQLAALGRPYDVDAVFARTRGHPLFTAQLAAHLPEDGLPSLLVELLDARLHELTDTEWRVVRTLGVADRALPATLIGSVASLPPDELSDCLRALDRRSLLTHSTARDSATLAHPLLAEAARRRLVTGEATATHSRLAEALATLPDPGSAEIAAHWQLAGDPGQEIGWRVAAARDSARHFDWAREAEHWLRVLDLWPSDAASVGDPPVTRVAATLAAIDALEESRQWQRASALSAVSETMQSGLDASDRAAILLRASTFRTDTEGLDVGISLIDEALELHRGVPPSNDLLKAMTHKRWLLMAVGRFEEAQHVARACADIAQTLDDARMARFALASLAWHEGVKGRIGPAMELFERGRLMFPDGSDPLGDVREALMVTDLHLLHGRGVEVIEQTGLDALDIASRWHLDNMPVLLLRTNILSARIHAGDVAGASALLGLAPEEALDADRWPLHVAQAWVETLDGRPEVGARIMESLWPEIVAEGEIDLEELTLRALVHFWNGTSEVILDRLLGDLDKVVDDAPVRLVAPALMAATRAVAETPRVHERIEEVHELVRRTRLLEAEDQFMGVHACTVAAELSRAAATDSVDDWARATRLWDRVPRPHDAAYARWRAAQCALREGQGTVAARLLKRAAADAREHVPLSEAIARTTAARR